MEQSWKFQVVHGPQVCLLSNMLTWNKNIMCLMCFFFHASYKIQHILIWICAKILCSFPFYRKLCMICFFRWSSYIVHFLDLMLLGFFVYLQKAFQTKFFFPALFFLDIFLFSPCACNWHILYLNEVAILQSIIPGKKYMILVGKILVKIIYLKK